MNTILKNKLEELLIKYLLSDYISIVDTDVRLNGAYVKVFVKKDFLKDRDKIKSSILKKVTA